MVEIVEGRCDMEYAFDEEAYLTRYSDLAAAVKSGAFKSGLEHFEQHGRAEGRTCISCETAAVLGRRWGENLSRGRAR